MIRVDFQLGSLEFSYAKRSKGAPALVALANAQTALNRIVRGAPNDNSLPSQAPDETEILIANHQILTDVHTLMRALADVHDAVNSLYGAGLAHFDIHFGNQRRLDNVMSNPPPLLKYNPGLRNYFDTIQKELAIPVKKRRRLFNTIAISTRPDQTKEPVNVRELIA